MSSLHFFHKIQISFYIFIYLKIIILICEFVKDKNHTSIKKLILV